MKLSTPMTNLLNKINDAKLKGLKGEYIADRKIDPAYQPVDGDLAYFFNEYSRELRTVRALASRGLIRSAGLGAIVLTDKGEQAIAA